MTIGHLDLAQRLYEWPTFAAFVVRMLLCGDAWRTLLAAVERAGRLLGCLAYG